MRVAMVGRYYNRQGGVSRVLAELSDRAVRDGDAVDIYAHEALDVPPGSPIRFVSVPMWTHPAWVDVATFAQGVARRLDRDAYDLVHVHDGQSLDADVVTAHSCYAAWLEGARAGAGIRGLLSRVHPRHAFTDRWERRIYRRGSDSAIVAISRVVGDELVRFHGVDPARIRVIHNGVDVDAFAPPASGGRARAALPDSERPADDRIVLLFVGMYFQRKGLGTLLEALGGLVDDPWELLVVGGDDAAPFRAQAQAAGIGDRVRFVGHRPDVASYFQAADAFVFPTAYEPFGLVITEALASAAPVITSATAGAAELMTDGRDGFLLTHPSDPQELREALQRFFALDDEQRAAMGAAARATAVGASWDAQWEQYARLFAHVAANRREGRPAWAF